jgi:Asp-tRNA(Asn)/Glu-tRNA(Gln) amidotransferase C subunit
MDVEELTKKLKDEPLWKFERELNELIRHNSNYYNLNTKNKEIIINLIKKHLDDIRQGRGISSYVLQQESLRLWQNRVKSGLTEEDLKDIKEILGMFKK